MKIKEGVESLLVAFVFCLFLQDSKKKKKKNKWKETLKEFAQAIFMMRERKITGSQEGWALPAILAASAYTIHHLSSFPQQGIEKCLQILKSSMSGLDVQLITSVQ